MPNALAALAESVIVAKLDAIILAALKRIHPGFAAVGLMRDLILKIPGVRPLTTTELKEFRKRIRKRGSKK